MVRRELLIATSTFFTCGLLLQTGAQYSAAGNSLCGDPQCFGRGSPGFTSKTTDECDSGCNFSCHFFKVLLEVQHPVQAVQAHAKVLWSLLKHQAFVIDKHVQFPFSFSVIEDGHVEGFLPR